jgi:hypothetical protein
VKKHLFTSGIALFLVALAVVGAVAHLGGVGAAKATGNDGGSAELIAAIDQAGVAAPAAIAAKFANMTLGAASFHSGVRTLRPGFYGAVRTDGAPCFYAAYGERGGRGFCLASFMGQPILTVPLVIRQYDSEAAPFDMFVTGLARANVRSVAFTLRDGRSVSTDVVRGVFSVRLGNTRPGDVTSVAITYRSGRSTALTPLQNYVPLHGPTR